MCIGIDLLMSTQSECDMISLSCCCTAGSVTTPFSTTHISVLGTYLFARQKWWREFFSRAPLKFMINILNLKAITGMAYILKKLKIPKIKVSSSSCWDLRTLVQMLLSKLFPLSSLSRVYYFPCYTTMTETSPIFFH